LKEKEVKKLNVLAAKNRVKDQFVAKDKAAARWAACALFMTFATLLLAYGNITLANKVKVIPYIVQVDKHGYEVSVGPLTAPDKIDERVVLSRLATFVTRWRTVNADPVAQKDYIEWVYSSIPAGTPAQQKINLWYSQNDPYKIVAEQKITRTVEINTVLKISDITWRIEWEEFDWDNRGLKIGAKRWTALLTYDHAAPKELANVIKNPLGVYVVEISFNPNIR